MSDKYLNYLKEKLDEENYLKVKDINNKGVYTFISDAIDLCEPDKTKIITDSPEDVEYVRKMAIETKEETPLRIKKHSVHFDGIDDQGRDRDATKYLVPDNDSLSKTLNQIDREEGLNEVRKLLKSSMKGRIMIVRFMTLGPNNSKFSIPCIECTDSFYVAHSLTLLYRLGYEEFKKQGAKANFFAILHSCGKMNEQMISSEPDKKRIYIDYTKDTVYSVNTQYAGNTIGLKKLALRLTIRKADRENWLAEHMFLMGVKGKNERKSYFAGAFPSACGKTSTAMLPGETIVGDDISYFRAIDGKCMAVNAESGIFGIIQNINIKDDPIIWESLHTPYEVIFSNVLINNGKPYWLGMKEEIPNKGENFSGSWYKGKKDNKEVDIPPAHKNARYSISLDALKNCDSELNNPLGVELSAIIYGGRDAKASVPVQQSFGWEHGIIAYGASLETETTFAIIGKEGVPEINLMSIQDFISIPFGKYIKNNLNFVKKLKEPPLIFGVNYFLRDREGNFVNKVKDKHIWIKWMELRVHNEVGAIKTPTGFIPKYSDLIPLFKELSGKVYNKTDYVKQFTLRISENIDKLERVVKFYTENVKDAPALLFEILLEQKEELLKLQKKFGNYISPEQLL